MLSVSELKEITPQRKKDPNGRNHTAPLLLFAFATISASSGGLMDASPFQILTDWQDKKGDKRFLKLGKDPDPAAPARHKPKKQKLDGKGSHGPGPGPGRPKSKNLQPKVQEYEFTDDPQDIPRTPKNDAPNRSAVKVYDNHPPFLYESMQ